MAEIALSYVNGTALSNEQALLEEYQIALLTGETTFSPDPLFGLGLDGFVDEQNTDATVERIKAHILTKTEQYYPQIKINRITITAIQSDAIRISLDVLVVPYNTQTTVQMEIT